MGVECNNRSVLDVARNGAVNNSPFVLVGVGDSHFQHLLGQELTDLHLSGATGVVFAFVDSSCVDLDVLKKPLKQSLFIHV